MKKVHTTCLLIPQDYFFAFTAANPLVNAASLNAKATLSLAAFSLPRHPPQQTPTLTPAASTVLVASTGRPARKHLTCLY